jgi:hypothetical protein
MFDDIQERKSTDSMVEVGEVPDWLYTTSENGWTSNHVAMGWLENIFLPETKPKIDEWRMLSLDRHESHISVDFL